MPPESAGCPTNRLQWNQLSYQSYPESCSHYRDLDFLSPLKILYAQGEAWFLPKPTHGFLPADSSLRSLKFCVS
ncbi:unnamed protein product [Clonostachys solani]|uniref:Uncharacterized protein n=1 Tax=Clonostachys solani TaxID=160281 RepID=A0A9N9Z6Z7_9HYPO|nr:unnamed protein product [Clonostachys solani]